MLEVDQVRSALKPPARKSMTKARRYRGLQIEGSRRAGCAYLIDKLFVAARDTTTELSLFHTLATKKNDRVAS